jgi:N-acetylmuramoyl-L-alanine amidase
MPTRMIYSDADLSDMFRTTWAEARGEGTLGETAVAWVIRNRAERAAYAHDLLGAEGAVARVCEAKWQFSCWNDGDPNKKPMLALRPEDAPELYDLCTDILEGLVDDLTGGADMYYAPQGMPGGQPPYWASACKQVAVISHQVFFDSRQKP